MSNNTSTDVIRSVHFDPETLRDIRTFDDALRLASQEFGNVLDASEEIGDGFSLLADKDKLIGVPIIFLSWTFSEGDYIDAETGEKSEFVTARVVAKYGPDAYSKHILNDGGTGIRRQLRQLTDRDGRTGGLVSRNGLRRSDYELPDGSPATTHYIDTSA